MIIAVVLIVIAVVLTGMGQDGLRGAKILKAQGASVLAQDEASRG